MGDQDALGNGGAETGKEGEGKDGEWRDLGIERQRLGREMETVMKSEGEEEKGGDTRKDREGTEGQRDGVGDVYSKTAGKPMRGRLRGGEEDNHE